MKIGYTPVLAAFVSVFKLGGVHALYIIAYLVAEVILIGSQTFLSIFICNGGYGIQHYKCKSELWL